MVLSDHQKSVVMQISENKIRTALDYLMLHSRDLFICFNDRRNVINGAVSIEYIDQEIITSNYRKQVQEKYVFLKPEMEENIIEELTEFSMIVNMLEEKNMICRLRDSYYIPTHKYLRELNGKAGGKVNFLLLDLFFSEPSVQGYVTFKDIKYHPSPLLKSFIVNGYKTNDELYNEKSIQQAKDSSKLAIIIAVASSALAALISISINLWNNQNQSKENESLRKSYESQITQLIEENKNAVKGGVTVLSDKMEALEIVVPIVVSDKQERD